MIRADLHIHSQYSSDGEFRPADIVGKCAAGGVDLFALTDHNTVRGLDEACDGALQAGLESVPGIEIDCSFEGTDLHLLGYGIDWKSPDFRALEETVAAKVMASFGETVGKLRRLGFAVDEQAVLAAAAASTACSSTAKPSRRSFPTVSPNDAMTLAATVSSSARKSGDFQSMP